LHVYVRNNIPHKTVYIEAGKNAAIYNHNIGQKLNLHVPFCRTVAFKKGIMNMITKLYNKLQNIIREVEELGSLKEIQMNMSF
jgi:hypothetical protein